MHSCHAVNAFIEGPNGGDMIVYRDYVDISVSVATEKGLITLVVRNAEVQGLVGQLLILERRQYRYSYRSVLCNSQFYRLAIIN